MASRPVALVSTLEMAYKPDVTRFVAVTPIGTHPARNAAGRPAQCVQHPGGGQRGTWRSKLPGGDPHVRQGMKAIPGRWERMTRAKISWRLWILLTRRMHWSAHCKTGGGRKKMTKGQVIVRSARPACGTWKKRELMGTRGQAGRQNHHHCRRSPHRVHSTASWRQSPKGSGRGQAGGRFDLYRIGDRGERSSCRQLARRGETWSWPAARARAVHVSLERRNIRGMTGSDARCVAKDEG